MYEVADVNEAVLTAAEKRVLTLVSQSMSNREIACSLKISPATVKRHLENTLRKLRLRNRVEAAIYRLSLAECCVVSWDDIVKNYAAWKTLAWFATVVALADGLTRVGFVKWFAQTVASQLTDTPAAIAVAMLLLINFFGHYLFASGTAHVTAMIPVLLAVASTNSRSQHAHGRTRALPAARHHGHHHAIRDRT